MLMAVVVITDSTISNNNSKDYVSVVCVLGTTIGAVYILA